MKRLPLYLSGLTGLAIAFAGCSADKGARRGPVEGQEEKAAEEESNPEQPTKPDPLKLGADEDKDEDEDEEGEGSEAGPVPANKLDVDNTTKNGKKDAIDERRDKKRKKGEGPIDSNENPEEEIPSD